MELQMKNKAILSAAVLLASLMSSTLTAVPASASTEDAVKAGKAIAKANGIILDSDADAAELAVLNRINGNALPELVFDNTCTVTHISGLISNQTVRNEKSALKVIASISDLLGIQDVNSELQYMESDSNKYVTSYTFRQMYHGIPVEDASITVFADTDTKKANYLNSAFVTDFSMDTTPTVSADRVRDIVSATYQTGVRNEPELMIVRDSEGTRKLAYKATTYDLEVGSVYISAENGSIIWGPAAPQGFKPTLEESDNYYNWKKDYANPVTGLKKFSVLEEIGRVKGKQRICLHDRNRDIYIINYGYAGQEHVQDYIWDKFRERWHTEPDETQLYCQYFLDALDISDFPYLYIREPQTPYENEDIAVGVMYQVERVYDYFSDYLLYRGTTNNKRTNSSVNDRLFIIPNYGQPGNAYNSAEMNIITFGTENTAFHHPAREIATVAHEYTHRILHNKLRWSLSELGYDGKYYYSEASAIDEAYSDIMSQYAELAIAGSTNWIAGDITCKKSGEYYRDMTKGIFEGNWIGDKYYIHYFKTSEIQGATVESHEGSTIISHAAYRMSRAGISPSDAQEIWFLSMGYMKNRLINGHYTFNSCRAAVLDAAKVVLERKYSDKKYDNSLKRKEMYVKIHSAFNYAEIFPSNSKPMGDINKDGIINANDVTLTKRYANNVNLLTDPEQIALGDVNYDGRITKQDAQIIQKHINQYGNSRNWGYHSHYDI